MEDYCRLLKKAPLIIVDNRDPQSAGRGIMVTVAELTTDKMVNLMATEGRSIVSLAIDEIKAFRLGLRPQSSLSLNKPGGRCYLLSIEAKACDGTGISAADRALTMRAAGAPNAVSDDLRIPGHIMPMLIKTPVTHDANLPDLAYQLVKFATGNAAAGWCDILDENGETASISYCRRLAERLDFPLVFAKDLILDILDQPLETGFSNAQNYEELQGWI